MEFYYYKSKLPLIYVLGILDSTYWSIGSFSDFLTPILYSNELSDDSYDYDSDPDEEENVSDDSLL